MGPTDRPARNAADVAARLLGRLDRSGTGMAQARAIAAWRDVAGREVARHARGLVLREGELVVFVDEAVWANELSMLSEHYRVAVNERLGKEAVRAIRFAVSKKVEEDRQWEAQLEAPAIERDALKADPVAANETELAQIHHMAAVVKTKSVREAVIAAATRNLEWRKGLDRRKEAEEASQRATEPTTDTEHKDTW